MQMRPAKGFVIQVIAFIEPLKIRYLVGGVMTPPYMDFRRPAHKNAPPLVGVWGVGYVVTWLLRHP